MNDDPTLGQVTARVMCKTRPVAQLPILQFVARPGILDLGWGHPRPELLPVAEWRAATAAMLDTVGWPALTYGYAAGPGPLVEWLAARNGTDPAGIFVTAGASQALTLLCQLLTEPGDTVLVDTPTYHLALRIFRDHGLRLATPRDLSGAGVAKFLYTVPTFGNPTGRSLSADARISLVRAAQRSGVPVVEDDTYRELVYDGTAPPSLWELSGGDGVIRVGSFAKTVGPGLRLGWIDAGSELVRRLVGLGYVDSGGGVNHATAFTMATFAASGEYEGHLARLRAAYREQRDALAGQLGVPGPAGGWFLWLRLPAGRTGSALLPVAEAHGVSFVEGSRFTVDGSGDDHIRLSFSMLPPAELAEAARRLQSALAAD
jgi:DNA-binding transcriptional MocR family regulator